MSGDNHVTIDHDTIRGWVEERGGSPATVKTTARKGEDAGLLRIDFPGHSGEDTLEHVDWDSFFSKFDESELAFVYQEKTADGEVSRFSKFVDRSTVEQDL